MAIRTQPRQEENVRNPVLEHTRPALRPPVRPPAREAWPALGGLGGPRS